MGQAPARSDRATRDTYTALCGRIRALPGVREGESRFGARPAFFRGRREFAHFHGRREIDIRLTRQGIARRRRALGRVPNLVPNEYSGDWMVVALRGCDLGRTMALVKAAYALAGR